MYSHPWHQVNIGPKQPDVVQSVIEIPQGSKAKYELDKTSGLLLLNRVLFSSFYYPTNYGFIPQTLGDDNDPLDILVISQLAFQPLCLISAKVIGVMRMIDNNEGDDKIIAVAAEDASVNHMNDIEDLSKNVHSELKNFFEEYKKLENKTVLVEDFQNAEMAKKIITQSIANYNLKYG